MFRSKAISNDKRASPRSSFRKHIKSNSASYVILPSLLSHFHRCCYFSRICDRHRRSFRVLRISHLRPYLERVSIDRFLLRCYRSPKSDRDIFEITTHILTDFSPKRQCQFISQSSLVVAFYEHRILGSVSSPRIDRKWRVRIFLGEGQENYQTVIVGMRDSHAAPCNCRIRPTRTMGTFFVYHRPWEHFFFGYVGACRFDEISR